MTYHAAIHPPSHALKSVLGHSVCRLLPGASSQLLVLNYHGTPKKFIQNFETQIQFLRDHFDIISPSLFKDILHTKAAVSEKKLLITFDDGLKNNLHALEVLDKYQISALHFIVPGFIETPESSQRSYYTSYIRPLINPHIDNETEDFTALSWADLKQIAQKHGIGSHTYTHTMSKGNMGPTELLKEIADSKKAIEQNLEISVDSFCSINNTLLSVGKNEKTLIEQYYACHFTTFGGNNLPDLNPVIIRRINVESHWLHGALRFALSPLELKRWEKKVNLYRSV